MRYFWSRFLFIFLLIEGSVFLAYYHWGSHGTIALQKLAEKQQSMRDQINVIKKHNEQLEDQIEGWKSSLFLQEKFARERLALQKDKEIIFFR